jgi:hypothetical protein
MVSHPAWSAVDSIWDEIASRVGKTWNEVGLGDRPNELEEVTAEAKDFAGLSISGRLTVT